MIRLIFFLLCMWCSPVLGADFSVRGGEHGEFTRIFIGDAHSESWPISRIDGGYLIDTPDGYVADTSQAFSRIGRQRLRSVLQKAAGLEILLNCGCGVRSFFVRGEGLVIDFSDQYPVEIGLPAKLGGVEQGHTGSDATETYGLDWKMNRTERLGLLLGLPLELLAETDDTPNVNPLVKRSLIAEVAAAATEGILMPSPDIGGGKTAPILEALDEAVLQVEIVRDSHDERIGVALSQQEDLDCKHVNDYTIGAWGNPDRLYEAISEARRNLIDEAGNVDIKWLRRLALAQLYAGQGLEASSILSSSEGIDDREILLEIATLVEAGQKTEVGERNFPALAASHCNPSLGLWRTLSGSPLPNDDNGAVLAEFSGLPEHLRIELGATLIEFYLDDGDLVSAKLARTAISRLGIIPSDALLKQYARMYEQAGEMSHANTMYDAILQAGELEAPAVAVQIVDLVAEQGSSVPKDTTDLIEALSFEYQGTDEGKALGAAAIKGLVISGEINEGLDLMLNQDLDDNDRNSLEDVIYQQLSRSTSQHELVALYVQNSEFFLKFNRSDEIRSVMAEALYRAGFSQQAEKMGFAKERDSVDAPEVTGAFETPAVAKEQSITNGVPRNLVAQGGSRLTESETVRAEIASLLSAVE